MEQTPFEKAVLAALRQVPEKQQGTIVKIVQTLVQDFKEPQPTDGKNQYSVERHREIRRLTATIQNSMAAAISAERDERG